MPNGSWLYIPARKEKFKHAGSQLKAWMRPAFLWGHPYPYGVSSFSRLLIPFFRHSTSPIYLFFSHSHIFSYEQVKDKVHSCSYKKVREGDSGYFSFTSQSPLLSGVSGHSFDCSTLCTPSRVWLFLLSFFHEWSYSVIFCKFVVMTFSVSSSQWFTSSPPTNTYLYYLLRRPLGDEGKCMLIDLPNQKTLSIFFQKFLT